MKTLVAIFVAVFLSSCAGSKVNILKGDYPNPYQFSAVEAIPDGKKGDLFVRAHEWIALTYHSAKTVIDMSDREAGKIICKATLDVESPASGVVSYVMTIDVKDGKARCRIFGFNHKGALYLSKDGSYRGTSYGDLQADTRTYKSLNTGKMTEDKKYYAVKNQVSILCHSLLTSFKGKMHEPDQPY